jgi:hypothetical protein
MKLKQEKHFFINFATSTQVILHTSFFLLIIGANTLYNHLSTEITMK